MSIDAITYVKTLPDKRVKSSAELLVLIFIAENTFSDSGLCRVGQQILAHDARMSLRTVQRHLKKLQERGTIKQLPAKGVWGGGRDPGAIELLGLTQWLGKNRSGAKVNEPVKLAASS